MHLTKIVSNGRNAIIGKRLKHYSTFRTPFAYVKTQKSTVCFAPVSNAQPISASHAHKKFSTEVIMDDFIEEDEITMKTLLGIKAGEKWKTLNKIQDNTPISIRFTRTSGRGLFSTKAHKEGEVVFEEVPFAAIPLNSTDFCNNCLQTLSPKSFKLPSGSFISLDSSIQEEPISFTKHPKIIRASSMTHLCPKCSQVKFCSQQCLDESHYHSQLCMGTSQAWKELEEMYKESETKIGLLVARIFASLIVEIKEKKVHVKHKGGEKIELSGGSWEFLQRLSTEDIEPTLDETEQREINILKRLFYNHEIVNTEIFKTLKSACYKNCSQLEIQTETLINTESKQAITRTDFPLHGSFLPFFGAFINHSCEPNLTANAQFNYVVHWTSAKDIEAGEELTTCYIPKELELEDRREMLWNQWGFWCTCPRCQREEKADQDAIVSK